MNIWPIVGGSTSISRVLRQIGFPHNFELGEVSEAPPCNASSSRCRNVSGDVITDDIVPASPALYVLEDLCSLSPIQAHVHQWLTKHHPSEISGDEGVVDAPDGRILDAYAADLDRQGD